MINEHRVVLYIDIYIFRWKLYNILRIPSMWSTPKQYAQPWSCRSPFLTSFFCMKFKEVIRLIYNNLFSFVFGWVLYYVNDTAIVYVLVHVFMEWMSPYLPCHHAVSAHCSVSKCNFPPIHKVFNSSHQKCYRYFLPMADSATANHTFGSIFDVWNAYISTFYPFHLYLGEFSFYTRNTCLSKCRWRYVCVYILSDMICFEW